VPTEHSHGSSRPACDNGARPGGHRAVLGDDGAGELGGGIAFGSLALVFATACHVDPRDWPC